MAKSVSKKRWIKAAVLAVGVADCLGIYYAQHRLDKTVPDEVRFDQTALMVPESMNRFHAGGTSVFGDSPEQAPEAALALAVPERAPVELAAASVVPAHAAAKAAGPASRLAAAPAARPAPAAKAAPAVAKAAALEGPRGSSVGRYLSLVKADARAAAAPAKVAAAAPIVTPHLARVARPAAEFHPGAGTLTSHARTALLALGASGKAPKAARQRPAAKPAAMASLVPGPRDRSVFAEAFAGLDAPVGAGSQLELNLGSVVAPAQTGLATAPVLELTLPAAPVELRPVSASADEAAARL